MFARILGLAPALLLASSGPARANGTIEGTIRIAAPAPAAAARAIVKDANVCGSEAPAESLIVGKGGGLANVVVSVSDARFAGAPPLTAGASIDQRRCRYLPHVQALTVGTPLAVMNNDAILHNVHARAARSEGGPALTVFNLALPIKGQKLPVVMRSAGLMKLQCDAGHSWMNAWIYVFDHPYHAVTNDSGAFVIADVPAGEHVVELWHEPANGEGAGSRRTAKIKVIDGKRARLDLTFPL